MRTAAHATGEQIRALLGARAREPAPAARWHGDGSIRVYRKPIVGSGLRVPGELIATILGELASAEPDWFEQNPALERYLDELDPQRPVLVTVLAVEYREFVTTRRGARGSHRELTDQEQVEVCFDAGGETIEYWVRPVDLNLEPLGERTRWEIPDTVGMEDRHS